MEQEVQGKVRLEQMRMLFETPLPGMLLATLFAAALALQMRGSVPDALLVGWFAAKCLTVLPRVLHALLFARRRSDSLAWRDVGIALMAIDGLAFGSAGVLLMVPHDVAAMTIVVTSLCAVAAVATFALHADWRACLAYSGGLLMPSIAYLLWRADAIGTHGAGSVAIFLGLLLAAARRSERHITEMLALRFHNARLTDELSVALAKAELESHAKDVFVANMSHELRTPLHGILGLSRSLGRTVAPAERETVALIRRSGEHLLGLINNILEFSRFRAHGIDVHATEVEVARVVDDAVALCLPNAQERSLRLSTEVLIAPDYVAISDPFRLRQILLNLLGNAIKFTEPGGSVVLRATERVDRPGIVITVADTGPGIAPEMLTRLFEPFSQGDSSASRRHGGTGLGLHITREICQVMGGTIACRSTLGRGSVFEVELPLVRVTPAAARGAVAASESDPGAQRHGGARVLLAEDNEVNAIVAEATLQRYGLQVEHVTTGRAVVDRLCSAAARPDLVLLDCQMPEMDGFEACRQVRAFERQQDLPRLPIVALTANVFQRDRERCLEAGMDAFLGKPFSDQELLQVLAQYALVESGRAEAPATA
jgi:signal transduction histidine kinase